MKKIENYQTGVLLLLVLLMLWTGWRWVYIAIAAWASISAVIAYKSKPENRVAIVAKYITMLAGALTVIAGIIWLVMWALGIK